MGGGGVSRSLSPFKSKSLSGGRWSGTDSGERRTSSGERERGRTFGGRFEAGTMGVFSPIRGFLLDIAVLVWIFTMFHDLCGPSIWGGVGLRLPLPRWWVRGRPPDRGGNESSAGLIGQSLVAPSLCRVGAIFIVPLDVPPASAVKMGPRSVRARVV